MTEINCFHAHDKLRLDTTVIVKFVWAAQDALKVGCRTEQRDTAHMVAYALGHRLKLKESRRALTVEIEQEFRAALISAKVRERWCNTLKECVKTVLHRDGIPLEQEAETPWC